MTPTIHYLQLGKLLHDKLKVKQIRKYVEKYTLTSGRVYKMGRDSYMLRCFGEHEITMVSVEVHQGLVRSYY